MFELVLPFQTSVVFQLYMFFLRIFSDLRFCEKIRLSNLKPALRTLARTGIAVLGDQEAKLYKSSVSKAPRRAIFSTNTINLLPYEC